MNNKSGKFAAVVAGLSLALAGCVGSAQDKPAAPPPAPKTSAPAPAPVEPPPPPAEPAAEVEAPKDNCGLDPADMDDATKAQCGLTTDEPATGQADPIECSGNNVPVQSLADGSWYCDYSGESEEGAEAPNYSNPDCTWAGSSTVYCEGSEGSYSYESESPNLYDNDTRWTPDYREPSSGEQQLEWGCAQGYITEGC